MTWKYLRPSDKITLENGKRRKRHDWYECPHCGKEWEVFRHLIRSGHSSKCRPCAVKLGRKHGHCLDRRNSPTRNAYGHMMSRCYNKNSKDYPNWGGRGITVCKRWRDDFQNFLEDMGDKPDGMTLDRIDNDKGYRKSNCRWATRLQQAHNSRATKIQPSEVPKIMARIADGETQTSIARHYGVTKTCISRIKRFRSNQG